VTKYYGGSPLIGGGPALKPTELPYPFQKNEWTQAFYPGFRIMLRGG